MPKKTIDLRLKRFLEDFDDPNIKLRAITAARIAVMDKAEAFQPSVIKKPAASAIRLAVLCHMMALVASIHALHEMYEIDPHVDDDYWVKELYEYIYDMSKG